MEAMPHAPRSSWRGRGEPILHTQGGPAAPLTVSTLDPDPPALEGALPAAPLDGVVQVVPLRLSELSSNALAAWDRLAARAAEPNPFFRREFVQAASAAHRDDPLLLVGASEGEWLLCLPVASAHRWRRLALPCLTTWRSELTYLSDPLVDRDHVGAAAAGLAAFAGRERDAAAIVLDPIDPHGVVGKAVIEWFLLVGHDPLTYAEWERGALRRRTEPTYVEEAMSPKRRK